MRAREPQPMFVAPILLTPGAVPDGDGWALELKWDGCRAQLRVDGRSVSLRTRAGRECGADFPELKGIAGALGTRAVTLDGELVCLREDGRPDFARLRRRLTGAADRRERILLQIFDLLHLDGDPTRDLPYAERRALLDELALDGPAWRTPASLVLERAEDFVARVEALGLDGVVAKRRDSGYLPGRRSSAWVKHKLRRHERLQVAGVRRSREGIAEALLVARRRPDRPFTGAGAVELGLRRELIEALERRFDGLPVQRRGAVCWYAADVSVIASVHGLPDGPVRDVVLREVLAA